MAEATAELAEFYPPSLVEKAELLLKSILALKNEARQEVLDIVDHSPTAMQETGVNGDTQATLHAVEREIESHPDINLTQMSLQVVPGTNKIVSKFRFESAFGVFADQLEADNVASEYFLPNLSRTYIDTVIAKAKKREKPLSLSEQFGVALELSHGNIYAAVLAAHFGSRAISRNMDTGVDPDLLTFTEEQMREWASGRIVADLRQINEEHGKKPEKLDIGDVYHFWGGVLGGLMTTTINHRRDVVCNIGYAGVHYFGDELTRFKDFIFRRESKHLHGPADKAGFKIGNVIGKNLKQNVYV